MELCSLPVIYLGPNHGGGNADNGNLLKRTHTYTATLSAPNPAAGHHRLTSQLETPGYLPASLGQSLVGSQLLSPGSWCAPGSVCSLQESISWVLCKFWQLYGRVNGNLLLEGLCHTQVCCTQGPCPCKVHCWPISPHEMLKQFCHSLCGVSVSWCTQCLFESSEHLWQVWLLILDTISPLLLSCCGFSFALGCGISPRSHSSATQPPLHC